MTTVSGIFLYSYDTTLASVSSIHLDEQGDAAAAAMAMLIVYISFLVRGIHTIISTFLLKELRLGGIFRIGRKYAKPLKSQNIRP